MNITTVTKAPGKVLVRGGGKQRTVATDTSTNINKQHGHALYVFATEVMGVSKSDVDWDASTSETVGPESAKFSLVLKA